MWNCILCWLNANGSRRKREPLTPCSYRLASRADSRWRVESGAEGQTAELQKMYHFPCFPFFTFMSRLEKHQICMTMGENSRSESQHALD
nr:uncharacterized protein LOC105490730 isoform X7 [Macaca nemestrina]